MASNALSSPVVLTIFALFVLSASFGVTAEPAITTCTGPPRPRPAKSRTLTVRVTDSCPETAVQRIE